MNLLELSKHWIEGARIIKSWLGEGGETVPQEEADRRAAICIACPLNKKAVVMEAVVGNAIKEVLQIQQQLLLHVKGEERLKTCKACDCPLKVKVWVPMEVIMRGIDEEELLKFDPACWIRAAMQPPKL